MNQPFRHHRGTAAPLLRDNVDTDQIIPSREMKRVSKKGLEKGLFAGWRYVSPDGYEKDPDFVLNQPPYRQASILVSGANFGCGSSREHAVWALSEFGIRAVIARSFSEIFHGNCIRNGLLPVALDENDHDQLLQMLTAGPRGQTFEIDLESQTISDTVGERLCSFEIEPSAREQLLNGLDPIDMTLASDTAINAFLESDRISRPWIYVRGS